MACSDPIRAWRHGLFGKVRMGYAPSGVDGTTSLMLPCGKCPGCRVARAREWAIRCTFEARLHDDVCCGLLSYAPDNLPPTLDKERVSVFVRAVRDRLRPRRIRFFASGEYGEENGRPHYHYIFFGASPRDKAVIEDAWGEGFVSCMAVTDKLISYIAGYDAKKLGHDERYQLSFDRSTGEILHEYQPPFILMSRRPGIGAGAAKWWTMFRKRVRMGSCQLPVPRYLHRLWRENATQDELDALEAERMRDAAERDTSWARIEAGAAIVAARLKQQASKRKI